MAAYPALIQLLRLLDREQALHALGLAHEPDPEHLSAQQRRTLQDLAGPRLEALAAALVEEAGASDDVTDRATGRAFVADRLAGLADLLTAAQVARLDALVDAATRDWDG